MDLVDTVIVALVVGSSLIAGGVVVEAVEKHTFDCDKTWDDERERKAVKREREKKVVVKKEERKRGWWLPRRLESFCAFRHTHSHYCLYKNRCVCFALAFISRQVLTLAARSFF